MFTNFTRLVRSLPVVGRNLDELTVVEGNLDGITVVNPTFPVVVRSWTESRRNYRSYPYFQGNYRSCPVVDGNYRESRPNYRNLDGISVVVPTFPELWTNLPVVHHFLRSCRSCPKCEAELPTLNHLNSSSRRISVVVHHFTRIVEELRVLLPFIRPINETL